MFRVLLFLGLLLLSSFEALLNRYSLKLFRYSSLKSPVTSLFAKDKNGKKKRPADGASASKSPSTPPPRVTSNSNIPVRQQIAWARAYRRIRSEVNKSYVTKKFRQERGDKQAEEEYVEIDYTNTPPPAVFVDGYNIIGYINSVEGRSLELHEARDCLISDLCVLKGATGWHIEVIFDAYQTGGPEAQESIDNVQVTYTSREETADNYIERQFAQLRAASFTNMVVATDDKVLQMVAGANGSGFISASMLLEELRIAYRGWENMEMELRQENRRQRPTLGDGLSPELRAAIETLKRAQASNRSSRQKPSPPTRRDDDELDGLSF